MARPLTLTVQRRRRERCAIATGASPRWLEAFIGEEPKEQPDTGALVVELGSGVRLNVVGERGAALAAVLLRGLGVGRC